MFTMTSSPLPPTVNVEDFAFQSPEPYPLSPHSKDQLSSPPVPQRPSLSPPHDYNINRTYDESSASATDHEDAYATTDDEMARLQPSVESESSRSSISSLPMSVAPSAMVAPPSKPVTPSKSPPPYVRTNSELRKLAQRDGRDMTPFRNPSSVHAMQMRDEFDDDLTPQRRKARMSVGRMSILSGRSSNSTTTSPTKRGGSRSNTTSPTKSKLKKEFPLVLLHCSLLPPTLGLQGKLPESWWLKEVLPEEYWNRWKILEDKVLGNGEVSTRGVLIPHPRADYELLEERLLESLELERPRVRAGHFLGAQHSQSETDEESEAENTAGAKCTDCGRKVPMDVEMERKWEVKVYAANGLMRAGAWGAAWQEMEKVDVEVGVWMPAEARREVEKRLHDMGWPEPQIEEEDVFDDYAEETEEERRQREIYGRPSPQAQEKVDGLFDEAHEQRSEARDLHEHSSAPQRQAQPADLQSLALNYLKLLAQDKRNVLIAVLSLLVLFYAMSAPSNVATVPSMPSGNLTEVVTSTVTAAPSMSNIAECISSSSSTKPLESLAIATKFSSWSCLIIEYRGGVVTIT